MESEKSFQNPCGEAPAEAECRLLHALARAGHSNTAPRRAIVRVLAGAQGSLSPAEILELGQALHPGLGLVTVYRTLDLLADLGLVRKIHLDDGCHSYALAGHAHSHHVICERCQQTVAFEGCDLSPLLERVARQTGFRVTEHWLELFGICPHCQDAEQTPCRARHPRG